MKTPAPWRAPAFDLGITHFDLANNYGPPYGSAEDTFGQILKKDFPGPVDELFISSKAGYDMWPGPYGNFGSKKYLVASLDQSLKRLGLDYVDLFYSHRPDPETPIEETMEALDYILRSGRALYVGISSYSPDQTRAAVAALGKRGSRLVIHQPTIHVQSRIEDGLQDVLEKNGMGSIAFCPLAQGLLTNRYLNGVAEGSRAAKGRIQVEEAQMVKVRRLNEIAQRPRPKLGTDGPAVGAARRQGDLCTHRRQPPLPDRRKRGGALLPWSLAPRNCRTSTPF